jgi:hypothetical protein
MVASQATHLATKDERVMHRSDAEKEKESGAKYKGMVVGKH